MKRIRAGGIAALLGILLSAAGSFAQAAAPFPVVDVQPPHAHSHRLANAAMIAGVGLIAASFAFERAADRSYDEYLTAIEPARITSLYDRAQRMDRFSSASLISGNSLLATGIVLRFVHRPRPTRVGLVLDAHRCAFACWF